MIKIKARLFLSFLVIGLGLLIMYSGTASAVLFADCSRKACPNGDASVCGPCHTCELGYCKKSPVGQSCDSGDACRPGLCDVQAACIPHEMNCGGNDCFPRRCVDGICVDEQPKQCAARADGGGGTQCCSNGLNAGKCIPDVDTTPSNCVLPNNATTEQAAIFWQCQCQYNYTHCNDTTGCGPEGMGLGQAPNCWCGGLCNTKEDCGYAENAGDCGKFECVGAGTNGAHCYGSDPEKYPEEIDALKQKKGTKCNFYGSFDDFRSPGYCTETGQCVQSVKIKTRDGRKVYDGNKVLPSCRILGYGLWFPFTHKHAKTLVCPPHTGVQLDHFGYADAGEWDDFQAYDY